MEREYIIETTLLNRHGIQELKRRTDIVKKEMVENRRDMIRGITSGDFILSATGAKPFTIIKKQEQI